MNLYQYKELITHIKAQHIEKQLSSNKPMECLD